MNGNIYQVRPLAKASFFQKLFRQFPEENMVIELNNLLAIKPIKDITKNEVEIIEQRYQLSLNKEFQLNLEEFYAVYLNYCLADRVLREEERNALKHLKHILNLDDKTIDKLHTKLGEIIYRKSYKEVIADGRLTKEKEELLTGLEDTLQLPKQLTDKISSEERTGFIQSYVARIIADQRLSPDEEQELQAITHSLKVNLQLNEQVRDQLRKLKLYWALENLALPVIQPDISIQKSEVCHIRISSVSWYELRSRTQRVNYGGYTTSIKIAKGFYLRSGSSSSQTYSTQTMTLIDKGTLYLTNKRIIFTGQKKNTNIRIEKILGFTPYEDGLEIGKDTGKSPTLQIPNNADIFCMMLERLINER